MEGVHFSLSQLPFDIADLTNALRSLYGRTSVPAHVAPSFIWKALAEEIGSLLFGWLAL